jgi:REP element-mobilizing transposase RayT
VFHEPSDYERFVEQLADALEKDGVVLYAYSLLANHFHLFLETPLGNIQRFMQRLNTAYSMYRRYKHDEPGHCFQGRYGAKLVSGDRYLTALTRYIHLNPVKTAAYTDQSAEAAVRALNAFRWSSYRGYVDANSVEEMIDYRWLGLMGCATDRGNRGRYRRYVEGFVKKADEELGTAMKASRYAIGEKRFVEQVESDLRDVREQKGVYGDIVWPEGGHLEPDVVVSAVAAEFGLEPEEVRGRRYAGRTAKSVAAELCCRYCGQSQRALGEHLGYRGNGAVNKQRLRLRERLAGDKALRRRFSRLQRTLGRS